MKDLIVRARSDSVSTGSYLVSLYNTNRRRCNAKSAVTLTNCQAVSFCSKEQFGLPKYVGMAWDSLEDEYVTGFERRI